MNARIPTAILCIASAVTLAAQNPMRPGRWEVTMQMQMARARRSRRTRV